MKLSENLLKAIKELDGATAAVPVQDIHSSSSVALPDYNDEESLTYCVMTGLLWLTPDITAAIGKIRREKVESNWCMSQ